MQPPAISGTGPPAGITHWRLRLAGREDNRRLRTAHALPAFPDRDRCRPDPPGRSHRAPPKRPQKVDPADGHASGGWLAYQ